MAESDLIDLWKMFTQPPQSITERPTAANVMGHPPAVVAPELTTGYPVLPGSSRVTQGLRDLVSFHRSNPNPHPSDLKHRGEYSPGSFMQRLEDAYRSAKGVRSPTKALSKAHEAYKSHDDILKAQDTNMRTFLEDEHQVFLHANKEVPVPFKPQDHYDWMELQEKLKDIALKPKAPLKSLESAKHARVLLEAKFKSGLGEFDGGDINGDNHLFSVAMWKDRPQTAFNLVMREINKEIGVEPVSTQPVARLAGKPEASHLRGLAEAYVDENKATVNRYMLAARNSPKLKTKLSKILQKDVSSFLSEQIGGRKDALYRGDYHKAFLENSSTENLTKLLDTALEQMAEKLNKILK
tara:strand:- start:90 stop:1148 length:1059 start_codon:yes stop_codon:yes gene_type:complete